MSRVIQLSVATLFATIGGVGCVSPEGPPEVSPPESSIVSAEYGFSYCSGKIPSVPVSRTVTCTGCNHANTEDCARSAASANAHGFCDTQLSLAGGAAACAPDSFDGTLCIDTSSAGVTAAVQFGSDTACGTWPFRHAMWRVTYNVTGDCGFTCRSSVVL